MTNFRSITTPVNRLLIATAFTLLSAPLAAEEVVSVSTLTQPLTHSIFETSRIYGDGHLEQEVIVKVADRPLLLITLPVNNSKKVQPQKSQQSLYQATVRLSDTLRQWLDFSPSCES